MSDVANGRNIETVTLEDAVAGVAGALQDMVQKPQSELVELTPRTTHFLRAMCEATEDKRSIEGVVNDIVKKSIVVALKTQGREGLATIGKRIVSLERMGVPAESINSTVEVLKRKAKGMFALAEQLEAEM